MKYPNETDFNAANKFGKGNANTAFAQYFIGNSFLNPLIEPQKANLFLANVTFEPGCRNNWHIHHASKGGGQILIAPRAKAGIRKRARRPFRSARARLLPFRPRLSIGTARKKTAGFRTLRLKCPAKTHQTNGASRFQAKNTINYNKKGAAYSRLIMRKI